MQFAFLFGLQADTLSLQIEDSKKSRAQENRADMSPPCTRHPNRPNIEDAPHASQDTSGNSSRAQKSSSASQPSSGNTRKLIQAWEAMLSPRNEPEGPSSTSSGRPHLAFYCGTVSDRIKHWQRLCERRCQGGASPGRFLRCSCSSRSSISEADIDTIFTDLHPLSTQAAEYQAKLRLAVALSFAERSLNLQGFLENHDEMMHALVLSKRLADRDLQTFEELYRRSRLGRDLGRIVQAQYNYLRMEFLSGQAMGIAILPRWRERWDVHHRFTVMFTILKMRILDRLTELDVLLPGANQPVRYRNVGPDHDVHTIGELLPWEKLAALREKLTTGSKRVQAVLNDTERDHCVRCCLCLEDYSSADSPLQLNRCSHIVGRTCMDKWLNSTEVNATTCPHCRTLLCQRRARQAASRTMAQQRQEQIVRQGLETAFYMLKKTILLLENVWTGEGRNACRDFCSFWNDEMRSKGVGWLVHVPSTQVTLGFTEAEWPIERVIWGLGESESDDTQGLYFLD